MYIFAFVLVFVISFSTNLIVIGITLRATRLFYSVLFCTREKAKYIKVSKMGCKIKSKQLKFHLPFSQYVKETWKYFQERHNIPFATPCTHPCSKATLKYLKSNASAIADTTSLCILMYVLFPRPAGTVTTTYISPALHYFQAILQWIFLKKLGTWMWWISNTFHRLETGCVHCTFERIGHILCPFVDLFKYLTVVLEMAGLNIHRKDWKLN